MKFRMEAKSIAGPFNLNQTMMSGHTAEPIWAIHNDALWNSVYFNGCNCKLTVTQHGTIEKPVLQVSVNNGASNLGNVMIKNYLVRLFDLNFDLRTFYNRFQDDQIADTFPLLKGLRLMRASDSFESLICSISSQNSSIQKWNGAINKLKRRLSKPIKMSDGSLFHPFPRPKKLANADERLLKACGFGYRVPYILSAARMVADGSLILETLSEKGYAGAKKTLIAIKGIGPKVADCFLLYGLGIREAAPVDIWINRIVSHIYLHDQKVHDKEVEVFFHHRFGEWAGLAHLYLYCYARTHHSVNLK